MFILLWCIIEKMSYMYLIFSQRSRDSGGEADSVIKQQLSSLNYLIKIIDNRMAKLQDNDHSSKLFFYLFFYPRIRK